LNLIFCPQISKEAVLALNPVDSTYMN